MDVLNLEDIIEKQALLLGLFVKIVPLVFDRGKYLLLELVYGIDGDIVKNKIVNRNKLARYTIY